MRRLATFVLVALAGCRSVPLPEARPWSSAPAAGGDTFLVLGDSRRGHPLEPGAEPSDAERIAYAERLRDEHPAFVVHVGDIAYEGADPEAWHDFDVDFAPLREGGVALLPAIGNHEYRGMDGAPDLSLYFARFPDVAPETHYARTFRGVRLLFLDSNLGSIGEDEAARQLAWLRERLDEAHADDGVRAVMLALHHPAYSNRLIAGESAWVRDEVLPLAARYPKVRALFAGHVHAYERFVVDGIPCIVTGGAGSPLQWMKDPDAPDARPDLYRGPRTFHYCRVRVGERITVEVVMRDDDDHGLWRVVDRFEL